MTTATPVDQLPLVTSLPVEHLFDMHVNLQPAQPIATPVGARITFITTGGAIDGPRLRGELLAWRWRLAARRQRRHRPGRRARHDPYPRRCADPLRSTRRHQDSRGRSRAAGRGGGAAVRGDLRADHAEVRDRRRALRVAVRGGRASATTSCRPTTSTTASIGCCDMDPAMVSRGDEGGETHAGGADRGDHRRARRRRARTVRP